VDVERASGGVAARPALSAPLDGDAAYSCAMGAGDALRAVLATAEDQVVAVVRLPSTALRAAEELRDAARALRRVADRVDGVLDDVEEPVRALAPGLRRLAAVLDDPLVADAPETLAKLRDEVLPALRGLRETQQRVASIAGSTDRISALIDETGGRLAALPGAAALLMRRVPRAPELDQPAPPAAPGVAATEDGGWSEATDQGTDRP
jgi:ABC-type transporter Mla subunit MlaD